ncbi:MAG: peptidase T [Planctomycetia bacterium]|nr:peptidase T [Planctomycetia bacterium]
METALSRFLKYAAIETTSQENACKVPSTEQQFELANLLAEELRLLGLQDVIVDRHCYVYATLPSNLHSNSSPNPIIGFIAHLDTSSAASGKNVSPQVICYEKGDIQLKNGTVIPEDSELQKCRGHQIVVSDGSTLLGADDKAGIAAIMTALDRLIQENCPHGTIKIAFTPDEEIGMGTAFFDRERFNADFAYTVDGGSLGEINNETFTADKAVLKIEGRDIHPGTAKGIMINASRILSAVIAALPWNRTPETTENREPFCHLYQISGNVSFATAEFLLRAFDETERQNNRKILSDTVEEIRKIWNPVSIQLDFYEQYLNMGYFFEKNPQVLNRLENAVRLAGLEPVWKPIRGGTDGSRLTEQGLPTPNIFTGGRNFHSPTEWLSVNDLEKTVETLIHLARV